jgi:hypothetical protein
MMKLQRRSSITSTRVLPLAVVSTILMSFALVASAQASQQSDWDAQQRYAVETGNLSYSQFVARQSDFRAHGCTRGWPEKAGDQPTWAGCDKPPPYNSFDWTDDGCSGREQIGAISNVYRNLFNEPCRQHDFGYRNFGKGLTLEHTEARRAWLDSRFRTEMKSVCNNSFAKWWQAANKYACITEADAVYHVIRVLSNWSTPRPRQASAPQPPPTPPPGPTPPPPPPPPGDSPTVSLSKGDSAQGQADCTSSACRYMVVSFTNFSATTHTITCHASNGDEAGFYSYTRAGSADTSAVCYYGFPGRTAWVTVDDVSSAQVAW